jgi:hypothetical protein
MKGKFVKQVINQDQIRKKYAHLWLGSREINKIKIAHRVGGNCWTFLADYGILKFFFFFRIIQIVFLLNFTIPIVCLRLFPCREGVGVFRQPLGVSPKKVDFFGLTFGFGYRFY